MSVETRGVSLLSPEASRSVATPMQMRRRITRDYPPEAIAYLSRGKTHYRLQGDPRGELIVLVHGFGLLYSMWDKMVEVLLQAGYQTLTYDMYGMGFSDSPRRIPYDINLLVGQIDELLRWIGVPENKPFHLVGFSQGGCVSASYAKLHPHQIKSLILIAPAGLSPYSYAWTKPLVIGGTILAYIVESRPIGSIARRLMQALSSVVIFACQIEMPPTEEEVRKLLARKLFPQEDQLKFPIRRQPTKAIMPSTSIVPSTPISPPILNESLNIKPLPNTLGWELVSTIFYDLGQMARQAYIALRSEMYFYSLSHLSVHGRLCTIRDFPFFQDLSEDVYRHVGKCVDKTMVVWGTKDRMLRYKEGLVDHIKAILPNAKLEVIQGVGHSVIVEKCVFLQNLILEFLGARDSKEGDEDTEDIEHKELQSSSSVPSLTLELGDEESETELTLLAPPMVNASCPNLAKISSSQEQQAVAPNKYLQSQPQIARDPLPLSCMKISNTPGIAFPSPSLGLSIPQKTMSYTQELDDNYKSGGLLPIAYQTVATTTKFAFNMATLPYRLMWFPVKTGGRIMSGIVRTAVEIVVGAPTTTDA